MFSSALPSEKESNIDVVTVLGGQKGDEGKGKVVVIVSGMLGNDKKFESFDLNHHTSAVIRFGGGSNAGHSVLLNIDGKEVKHVTNLLPSGALVHGVLCVIGPMCVVDIDSLRNEVKRAQAIGFEDLPHRLVIDPRAHVVTAEHIERDIAAELARGKNAIGTTKTGNGPAYEDMASRNGIRIESVASQIDFANLMTTDDIFDYYEGSPNRFTAVMEGAQSIFLDKVIGDYPNVTSGPSTFETIYSTGLPMTSHNTVVMVLKMYETAVGNHRLPKQTEEEAVLSGLIATEGHEFGAKTGRPRQCSMLNMDSFDMIIRRCSPANGKLVFIFNKGDVLEAVNKNSCTSAFRLVYHGKKYVFDSIDQMQEFIRKALVQHGVPAENVRFSSTPREDPSVLV